MAKRRFPERWDYWQGMIQQQQRSGLSVAAFCRQHKLSPPSFFAWRKKLAEQEPGEERPPQGLPLTEKFVPIELAPRPADPAGFEIVLPNGSRILLPAQFDGEDLRQILRLLEEISAC